MHTNETNAALIMYSHSSVGWMAQFVTVFEHAKSNVIGNSHLFLTVL